MITFGQALDALKAGARVSREGWNGKGMWLILVTDWDGKMSGSSPEDYEGYHPFIAMYTVDKRYVPWQASQTDVLAEDWSVIV